jgi:hypothetical protein
MTVERCSFEQKEAGTHFAVAAGFSGGLAPEPIITCSATEGMPSAITMIQPGPGEYTVKRRKSAALQFRRGVCVPNALGGPCTANCVPDSVLTSFTSFWSMCTECVMKLRANSVRYCTYRSGIISYPKSMSTAHTFWAPAGMFTVKANWALYPILAGMPVNVGRGLLI